MSLSNLTGQEWARRAERPFLRRVHDWLDRMEIQHSWYLTDFLTPREQIIVESLVRNRGNEVMFEGGYAAAERKRALLMPENWYPESSDFRITKVLIRTAGSEQLSHRHVLGSVLGTGIERRVLGDISTSPSGTYLLVCEEMVQYVLQHVHHVGRTPVQLELTLGDLQLEPPEYQLSTVTVASLRADAVLAQACHWSRSQAQSAISKGLVTLNFVELTDADENVAPGDLFSVRGFGRVKVIEIMGQTKRDRTRIQVGILQSSGR